MSRILGIDPGLRTTGYGAIAIDGGRIRLIEAGVLRPPVRLPFEMRLRRLFEALSEVIASVRPTCMVIEEIWVGERNPTSALSLGHTRGVLCLAAALAEVEVQHLAHAKVKRAITGSGRATKAQVRAMAAVALNISTLPGPEDLSDALALALAYANHSAPGRLYAA